MSIKVMIPTPLRVYAGKRDSAEIAAATVGEALGRLTSEFDELRKHLFTEDGKLRAFVTTSFVRFLETRQMEALLFQGKVRKNAGVDYGGGFTYRPPLSDNIVIVGGVQAMKLGQGLKDIYERSNLFSIFVNARLQF